ncbi:MAG: hypothetical protein ACK6DZ_00945, partial [Acidobacteriota bacterium]
MFSATLTGVAPDVNVINCEKFRAFSGRSTIFSGLITLPNRAVAVSRVSLPPITNTDSFTSPNSREKSSVAFRATRNSRPLHTIFLNPSAVNVMSYTAGRKDKMPHSPEEFVVTVRGEPVAQTRNCPASHRLLPPLLRKGS